MTNPYTEAIEKIIENLCMEYVDATLEQGGDGDIRRMGIVKHDAMVAINQAVKEHVIGKGLSIDGTETPSQLLNRFRKVQRKTVDGVTNE